jgi:hypothetical protein
VGRLCRRPGDEIPYPSGGASTTVNLVVTQRRHKPAKVGPIGVRVFPCAAQEPCARQVRNTTPASS